MIPTRPENACPLIGGPLDGGYASPADTPDVIFPAGDECYAQYRFDPTTRRFTYIATHHRKDLELVRSAKE